MHKFTMSLLDMDQSVSADTELGLAMIRGRKDWDSLSIQPFGGDAWPRLSLTNYESHGIVVHVDTGESDGNCILARGPMLRPPSVKVDLSGQSLELWPAELFVDEDLARLAVKHFLASGDLRRDLHWFGLSDFERVNLHRPASP